MAWLLHQKILLGHLHGSMLSAKRINLNQGSSVDDDSSFTYDEVKSACALAVAHMGTLRVSEGLETECPKALYQQLIRSRLAVAAYLNNEELIMSLISKGADVNASEEWFGPPLNAAAYSSRFSLVKLSIEHGADPNVPNYLGELIMVAVRERNKPLLRVLLSSDRLDPNTRDKHGYYPLSIACSSGALDTVHLILKHNRTDPNVISFFGTPIATAASLGHKHIVKLLMERDDVNIGLGDKSNWPLTRAADNGHGDVVEILLDKLAKDSDEYLRF
ncbi:hypothetical protein FQN49_002973 [Arthroderma sp. PD_2]|nr:hypothetical protein FQN49_002973 [Arthroderma sp. PD_2]